MADRPASRPARRAPREGPRGDYGVATKALGGIAALVMPMLCLVLAVMMLGEESHPARRRSLQLWMRISIGAIVVTVVTFTVFILATAGG